jgi:threonine/homoserine/homoserine lactone efflux protein
MRMSILRVSSERARPAAGTPHRALLLATRIGLPVVIAVVGLVLIVIGHGGTNSPVAVTGLVLIGIAIMVWMLNWMFRMSMESNDEREVEEQARDYYSLHGHWPDEPEE